MSSLDKAIDVALLELAGESNPHDPTLLASASLSVQESVELPCGREKVIAFMAAQTAADIAEVWGCVPEDFYDTQ